MAPEDQNSNANAGAGPIPIGGIPTNYSNGANVNSSHNSSKKPNTKSANNGPSNTAYRVGGNIYKGGRKGLNSTRQVVADFKAFIKRGNVFDLAVGVIMGAAFTTIVNSLVEDIFSPLIGLAGSGNLSNLFLVLRCPPPLNENGTPSNSRPPPRATCQKNWGTFQEAQKFGAITWNYGNFIQKIINFIIISIVVFFFVKLYSAAFLRKQETKVRACPECTKDIPQMAKRCPECTSVVVPTIPNQLDTEDDSAPLMLN